MNLIDIHDFIFKGKQILKVYHNTLTLLQIFWGILKKNKQAIIIS